MNQNRVIVCCDKHTSLNTREEDKKECPPKKNECAQETVNTCNQVKSDPCKKLECEPKKVGRSPCQKFDSEPKQVECGQRTAKLSGCCAKASVCEQPMKQCSERVLCPVTANVVNRGCDDEPAPQRSYIPEKMEAKCACVKFNGLQDSCSHPNCCAKHGCLGVPFPTCPPAQKWQREFVCNNKKNCGGC